MATTLEMFNEHWKETAFCGGLDLDLKKCPEEVAPRIFLRRVIDNTHSLVAAYKPNLWFFLRYGPEGLELLIDTIDYIHEYAPGVPVILDCKVGDVMDTMKAAGEFAFKTCHADAITVNPYMGSDVVRALDDLKDLAINFKDKFAFVLCRTSNPSAGAFQDQKIKEVPLYHFVASYVADAWNIHRNLGLVVGATAPEELRQIRFLRPDIPFLVPGIGKQGGDLELAVKNGMRLDGTGILINSSSGFLYPKECPYGDNFAENVRDYTRKLRIEINKFRRMP